MIVRTLDEITDTDRDVKTENWRSKRIASRATASGSRCTRPSSMRARSTTSGTPT